MRELADFVVERAVEVHAVAGGELEAGGGDRLVDRPQIMVALQVVGVRPGPGPVAAGPQQLERRPGEAA